MASRRKSHWAEDLVLAPWWVSFSVAILAFVLLPALLPSILRALSLPVTFLFLALSAFSILRSWKSEWTLDRQTGLASIRELSSKQFENLLGEAYRRQGYKVEETLGGGADGGVDLVLRCDGAMIIVQCKRWVNRPVPVQIVRELYGVMHDQHATGAKLITTSSFTSEARAFAVGKPIEMVCAKELIRLIGSVQRSGNLGDHGTEAAPTLEEHVHCPICNAQMVRRKAKRGANAGSEFYGCSNYPKTGCRGTREA